MIPILYGNTETLFSTNGLGRLRDCISCTVTEERNGVYECDFEYPINGINYELIKVGRIIGVTHDDQNEIQPFDIVSYSKPLDGIVSFHCTHISYRQSYMTVTGTNINSLSDAFTLFGNATPTNPFAYTSDMTKSGYLACADGIPRSVRQMLGGIEGSVLDTYGGEYEWDKWNVILHSSRGVQRPFAIRYGVNMMSYTDELDTSDSYSSCIPYWTDGEQTVVASKVDSSSITPANHGETVPLDLSEKFETKPTTTALRNEATSYMNSSRPYLPTQTINVSFARLQDMAGYEDFINLERCELCDTIKVIFPDYDTNGYFKIVKTVWDALSDKYTEMELGSLSTTLSEALGISVSPEKGGNASPTFDSLNVTNDITAGGSITATGNVTAANIGAKNWVAPSAVSCQTGKWYKVAEVTLDAGIWLIDCNAAFPATNTTGTRQIRVTTATFTNGTTTAPTSYGNITNDILVGANTVQYPQSHFPVDISSQTTFRLAAYQGSGSTMSVTGRMYAIRIK